jgi:hypothetical protein
MRIFLVLFIGLIPFNCLGQPPELQVDFYMNEARTARKNGDYKLACELSSHASELATYVIKGSIREQEAILLEREICKVVADKEKAEERERAAAWQKSREEEKRNHQAMCRRLYPAYRTALDQCASASNLKRCLGIKLGNDNKFFLESLDSCGR